MNATLMNSHRTVPRNRRARAAALAILVGIATIAQAQAPAPPAPTPPAASDEPVRPDAGEPGKGSPASPAANGDAAGAASDAGPLAPLAWLAGCWQGTVNQREFREQWLPLRGEMLVGAGQQVMRGRVQDYEFLRLEARTDGIYFSQFSGDLRETSFKLAGTTTEEKDTIFTFANTVDVFPARLVYRRGIDGWLYETVEGRLNGGEKKVIYPMRRIDCESGELILK